MLLKLALVFLLTGTHKLSVTATENDPDDDLSILSEDEYEEIIAEIRSGYYKGPIKYEWQDEIKETFNNVLIVLRNLIGFAGDIGQNAVKCLEKNAKTGEERMKEVLAGYLKCSKNESASPDDIAKCGEEGAKKAKNECKELLLKSVSCFTS